MTHAHLGGYKQTLLADNGKADAVAAAGGGESGTVSVPRKRA